MTDFEDTQSKKRSKLRPILLLVFIVLLIFTVVLLVRTQETWMPTAINSVSSLSPTLAAKLNQNFQGNEVFETSTIIEDNNPGVTLVPTSTQPTNISTATTEIKPISHTSTPTTTPDALETEEQNPNPGTIFIAIKEGGYHKIFAYHPQNLPFTRLMSGPWDDTDPSYNSDGSKIAFSSNRDGHWNIYTLNLTNGQVAQVTNTLEYVGSPSWSPDGKWMTYEAYTGGNSENLEIFIQQVSENESNSQDPIRLTNNSYTDHSPVWSPNGRLIAFVSNRSGEDEIWTADLDKVDQRFQNISQSPTSADQHPSWSSEGTSLAWSSLKNGYQHIYIKTLSSSGESTDVQYIGSGNRPIWNSNATVIYSTLETPNQMYISGYSVRETGLALSPISLIGTVSGLSWGSINLERPLPEFIQQAAHITPTPRWHTLITPAAPSSGGRKNVVELNNLEAPYPFLNDGVDESFNTLRSAISSKIGWDFLSSLENAYVPLTAPLSPGMQSDWLYTGRAFAFNRAAVKAGWVILTREDFGSSTYWRIFLRTRLQDGSQGTALHHLPWNFDARYTGNPIYYEEGGALEKKVPSGYWVDFTQLAADFGWERLPALTTWRSSYSASRFNEFIRSDGLDWHSAMLEIYPPEAITTPIPNQSPTSTSP